MTAKPDLPPLADSLENARGDAWRELESTFTPMEHLRAAAPSRYKKLLQTALLGTSSPRGAIKAFCQQCVGYEDLPASVRDCTAKACALWAKRPYQGRK